MSPNTQRQVISTFEHYIIADSAFGRVRLQDASLTLLQGHCDMIHETGKNGAVEKIKSGLTAMFKRAMAYGLIDRNPASGIILPSIEHKELRTPSLDEARRLLVALADPSVFEHFRHHREAARKLPAEPLYFMRVRVMALLDCALDEL